MWSISDVKEKGKAAFKANYWRCVLVGLILTILAAGSSASGSSGQAQNLENTLNTLSSEEARAVGLFIIHFAFFYVIAWICLRIFLLNHVEVGCHNFLKKNILTPGIDLSELKAPFSDYKRTLITILLRDVFLALWFCLLFIPGIIKAYSYTMVPYILQDDPSLAPREVINRSREMMNGHKWRAFLLDLSFIGWILLSLITCGIVGLFWTNPYMHSAKAALYLELKNGSATQE